MTFTAVGQTLIPTGRSRTATITWLSPDERTTLQRAQEDALVGDADLRAWMFRQQALSARFSVAPLVEDVLFDVEDPIAVLGAVREAFLSYELLGDPPDIEELLAVPEDADV